MQNLGSFCPLWAILGATSHTKLDFAIPLLSETRNSRTQTWYKILVYVCTLRVCWVTVWLWHWYHMMGVAEGGWGWVAVILRCCLLIYSQHSKHLCSSVQITWWINVYLNWFLEMLYSYLDQPLQGVPIKVMFVWLGNQQQNYPTFFWDT